MTRNLFLILLLISSQIAFAQQKNGLEYHVSPNGNDKNNGTISKPFATITGAREALQKSRKPGIESCSVIIHAGTYRLNKPVTFTPKDGGTKEAPVTYRAAGDGKVIITGAQIIDSKWKLWEDDIFRTKVKTDGAIDQLFVNGKRRHMARYPDYDAGFVPVDADGSHRGVKAGFAPFDGCTPDAWDDEKASEWKNPEGAFLHGMQYALWGSMHFKVLCKNSDGSLKYEGGWQNNRKSKPHKGYRMIENIFEELDAPGEWYYDVENEWLYYKPDASVDMNTAVFEVVGQIEHLIEIYGEVKQPVAIMEIANSGNGLGITKVKIPETVKPVKHITIEGLYFTGTARTFMKTIEPLLRSDWTIYRGGAIHLLGTEDVSILNCDFEELGGNSVFVDGHNRHVVIKGNYFNNNGASDVNLVGSFAAVREPAFSYGATPKPLHEVDTEIGPKTDEYPADCLVENNLIFRSGRFEKQVAGVNISMASRITVRNNTISHTPRAAINICDGTWGGHLIEWNDCFETVQETSDHGSFNSWGRDRYWHSAGISGPNAKDENGKPLISYWIEKYPESPYWDAYQTTVLRNNRMQCDHGWDIDLDDGSSNYEIYNNLCLSGGLKTREGYKRIVTNNIILHESFDCRVPYPKPVADVFMYNILWGKSYRASSSAQWGGVRNFNFAHNPEVATVEPAINLQGISEDDDLSLYGNAMFTNPKNGDFTVAENSPALRVGFEIFETAGYGVISERLKKSAQTPEIKLPVNVVVNVVPVLKTVSVLGAEGRALKTKTDLSATGMFDLTGFILINVSKNSRMAYLGFVSGDVVLEIDKTRIHNENHFKELMEHLKPGTHKAKIMRAQREEIIEFDL